MADYKVVDTEKLESELTGMADEVRTLADNTDKMSLEVMTDNVAQANSKVDSQSEIIAQIKTALQGKAVSGGGDDDFIGIKYSNYSGKQYNLPTIADARSYDKILEDPKDITNNNVIQAVNGSCLAYAFANTSANANGGYFVQLEEVYLPTKATAMAFTFQNCSSLKRIYGDFVNIRGLNVTFSGCHSLEDVPYMPNLTTVGNRTLDSCRALTKYVVPPKVTSIHTGAFTNTPNLLDIYVAFAEGAISGAPWGATNATIHYNTQYDENGNPITT